MLVRWVPPLLYPCPHSLLTLLHRGVGIGQEAEMPLVIPADQRHVALRPDLVLAPGKWGDRVGQHGWREACAVTLPGAEEAAAVDPWKERYKLSHVPLSGCASPRPGKESRTLRGSCRDLFLSASPSLYKNTPKGH